MSVIIVRPDPWCPDCHAAQMVCVEREKVRDELTFAECTKETWRCPKCDESRVAP